MLLSRPSLHYKLQPLEPYFLAHMFAVLPHGAEDRWSQHSGLLVAVQGRAAMMLWTLLLTRYHL